MNVCPTLFWKFFIDYHHPVNALCEGAQRLSGRVLDSRPKGWGSSFTGVTALLSLSKTE